MYSKDVPRLALRSLASHYGIEPSAKEFGGALSEKIRIPFAKQILILMPSGYGYDHARFDQRQYSRSVETGRAMTGEKTKFSRNDFRRFSCEYQFVIRFSLGSSEVLYLDNDSERFKIAENLGAIAVPYSILPKPWERKFPLITD